MNSISQFWSIRSKRERKLIAFVILMLALFIIINGFSNLLSSSGSAKRQYISAKTDYEYVKSGAKQLFYKSRAKEVQNNQQLLRKLLAELAQVNNITLTQINISEAAVTTSFATNEVNLIISFIGSVTENLGLRVKGIVLETSDEVTLTTIDFILN